MDKTIKLMKNLTQYITIMPTKKFQSLFKTVVQGEHFQKGL